MIRYGQLLWIHKQNLTSIGTSTALNKFNWWIYKCTRSHFMSLYPTTIESSNLKGEKLSLNPLKALILNYELSCIKDWCHMIIALNVKWNCPMLHLSGKVKTFIHRDMCTDKNETYPFMERQMYRTKENWPHFFFKTKFKLDYKLILFLRVLSFTFNSE